MLPYILQEIIYRTHITVLYIEYAILYYYNDFTVLDVYDTILYYEASEIKNYLSIYLSIYLLVLSYSSALTQLSTVKMITFVVLEKQ